MKSRAVFLMEVSEYVCLQWYAVVVFDHTNTLRDLYLIGIPSLITTPQQLAAHDLGLKE